MQTGEGRPIFATYLQIGGINSMKNFSSWSLRGSFSGGGYLFLEFITVAFVECASDDCTLEMFLLSSRFFGPRFWVEHILGLSKNISLIQGVHRKRQKSKRMDWSIFKR